MIGLIVIVYFVYGCECKYVRVNVDKMVCLIGWMEGLLLDFVEYFMNIYV